MREEDDAVAGSRRGSFGGVEDGVVSAGRVMSTELERRQR